MKLYDITGELFSTPVFPGDPEPKFTFVKDMRYGDDCNLSNLTQCTHNGTHADAPKHFINNGITIDEMPLEKFIGPCKVVNVGECIGKEVVEQRIKVSDERILFKGACRITKEGAQALARCKFSLVGVESMSVAVGSDTIPVHRILLRQEIAILENLDLSSIEEGKYFLTALPLKMKGLEASPVRAVLMTV